MALALPRPHSAGQQAFVDRSSRFVAVALAYAVAAWLASLVAIAPGHASPLYPATGIALACVLVYGRRVLPAIAVGSFAADVLLLTQRGTLTMPGIALAATFAVGAALQSAFGVFLIERVLRRPVMLADPSQVLRFLGAGLIASSAAAGTATLVLDLAGAAPPAQIPMIGATWWLGSLFGAWIAAPAVMTLISDPKDAWAPRRLSVGLTLLLVITIVAAGIVTLVQWNGGRTRAAFRADAKSAAIKVADRLLQPTRALGAMHALLTVSRQPTRAELQLVTPLWLETAGLQAMGWSERLPSGDAGTQQARGRGGAPPTAETTAARIEGVSPVETGSASMPAGAASAVAPSAGAERIALRFVEAPSPEDTASGVDAFHSKTSSPLIERARRSDRPTAGTIFPAAQAGDDPAAAQLVMYQAVYAGAPATPAERHAATRGIAFVTLKIDGQLRSLAADVPRYLQLCIVNTGPGGGRIAGNIGCDAETASMSYVRPLAFADRSWDLRVFARAEDVAAPFNLSAWLFSLIGLLAGALIGAFLLAVTGRTRRIEIAVLQRTAALEAEVGEREIAEAALRDSEQRFRNILDNVPIGVIYTNLAGDVIQANPRFCELTGYAEGELLSLSLLDFTHSDDAAQEVTMAEQLVLGEIPMYRRNKRYIRKSGATVWVQATVSLLRDSQNQPWRIVGVVEDITEHLRLEEAEHAREAAEASNRAKSEFLSRMSHELRTPLNAMLGFAQLLELDQRHPLTEAQRPWVVQIQQAGWHLLEMINDVLDLSRIESGNLRLQTDNLRLPELLEATVAMVASDANARGIVLSQDLAPGTSGVLGDATRIKQIFTNLLSNAVKYNSDGGRIHIASRVATPDMLEVSFTDTGLGMTSRQMAELFQPFNRLGRERTSHQGTGIGLVISQRLAELMGGSLRARSVAGQGSSFILTLPRVLDTETVPSDHGALDSAPTEYHRRVVHYVEDNETNVEVMRGILAQRPQVQMQVSITGLDALAAVRAHYPDLILLDMHLPDISGLDLLRHLKQDPHTAHVPIVVVSADALAQQIADALEAGADRYLTKPVSVSELLGVLDELLGQTETSFH